MTNPEGGLGCHFFFHSLPKNAFLFPEIPFYFPQLQFHFHNCPSTFWKCPFVSRNCIFVFQKILFIFQKCPILFFSKIGLSIQNEHLELFSAVSEHLELLKYKTFPQALSSHLHWEAWQHPPDLSAASHTGSDKKGALKKIKQCPFQYIWPCSFFLKQVLNRSYFISFHFYFIL